MQTSEPIRTAQWLSIHTISPSQTSSPSSKNQGYLIVTRGLQTKPRPTVAPKQRRMAAFMEDGSSDRIADWKKSAFTRYQAARHSASAVPRKFRSQEAR